MELAVPGGGHGSHAAHEKLTRFVTLPGALGQVPKPGV